MNSEENFDDDGDREVVLEKPAGLLSNAPWWLVSVGLHLVLLLAATLVAIERLHALETPGLEVRVTGPDRPLFSEIIKEPDPKEMPGGLIEDKVDANVLNEPAFIDPSAKLSDHAESDDKEDFRKRKGDSELFTGWIPGKSDGRGRQPGLNPGSNDTLGVGAGGGAGGRYGGRFGGRENLRPQFTTKGPPKKTTEDAVRSALQWLARHQGPDGGWGADSFGHQCKGGRCAGGGDASYDTGVTGLSVLAFLGAGYTPVSKDEFQDPADPTRTLRFGEVVKKGLQWLIAHQDPEGCVGERGTKYLYNHSVAALALSEAYGMTASAPVREPAQKSIDFLIAAQNAGKAWRYSAKSGENDSSVSGWAVMALKSAELSELSFPKSAFEGALNWFGEATSKDGGYYRVGYNAANTGKVYVPGHNEAWDDHPALTAVGVMSRIFIQKNRKEPALTGVTLLLADLPEWKQNKVDFYYWYYASLALFQYDGPEGPLWSKWNEPMKNAIVPHQKGASTGCANGSWDTQDDRWAFEGGRVYATAINALTLEVYYRYANVFGGGTGGKK